MEIFAALRMTRATHAAHADARLARPDDHGEGGDLSADNPLRNQVSSTELALWIAKSFIEMHGGTIAVRSQPGVGSIFTITLRLRRVPASVAESPLG